MTDYEHTQPGTLIRWSLSLGFLFCVALAVALSTTGRPPTLVSGAVALLLLVCLYLFHSLHVKVDADRIELSFGPGTIRKTIPFFDIRAASAVRNRWYFGWGIRFIPNGRLWNVSGLDAVELTLSNGKRFRIGTDDQEQLLAAISAELAARETVRPRQQ